MDCTIYETKFPTHVSFLPPPPIFYARITLNFLSTFENFLLFVTVIMLSLAGLLFTAGVEK